MASKMVTTLRRLVRSVLTLGLTGIVFVAAGAAAITGTSVLAARNAVEQEGAVAPVTGVRAVPIELQGSYEVERRFSGAFEAAQEVSLSFELGGTITEVRVDEGDTVARGDVLARLDTRLLEQERARLVAVRQGLEAQAELARRTNLRQQELRERGFATDQRVDDTSLALQRLEAGILETEAAVASVDVRISKADLRAPFDGQISARLLDVGAVGGQGAPVLRLIEQATDRFRVGLAPELAATFEVGDRAVVDVGGRRIEAMLTHLAPRLDEATRSRAAFFTPLKAGGVTAGQTGELVLRQRIDAGFEGAWLPVDALRQGPRGSWTVLTIEGDASPAVVGLAAIEIVHVDTGRVFVRGTFGPDTKLIDAGTHRVVPGERVEVLSDQEVLSWAH